MPELSNVSTVSHYICFLLLTRCGVLLCLEQIEGDSSVMKEVYLFVPSVPRSPPPHVVGELGNGSDHDSTFTRAQKLICRFTLPALSDFVAIYIGIRVLRLCDDYVFLTFLMWKHPKVAQH